MTANGGFVANANFTMTNCNYNSSDASTLWTITGGNTLKLRNNTAYCLDANTPSNGSLPILKACSGGASQQWIMTP